MTGFCDEMSGDKDLAVKNQLGPGPLLQTLLTCRVQPGLVIDAERWAAFEASAPVNSLRSLRADLRQFDLWCRKHKYISLPAISKALAEWLRYRSDKQHIKPATLERNLASVSKLHRLLCLPDPTKDETVSLTLYGLRRQHRGGQRQSLGIRFKGNVADVLGEKPKGLSIQLLMQACENDLRGQRDRALISFAYDTGMRRSEIIAVTFADIEKALDPCAGLVRINRSKSDQLGEGASAYLSPRSMAAITAWASAAGINDGPLFRRVYRWKRKARSARPASDPRKLHGRATWDAAKFKAKPAEPEQIKFGVSDAALNAGSISPIFKLMVNAAFARGMLPEHDDKSIAELISRISGHSMRVGLTQDLFSAGEDIGSIMDALRWQSPKMPLRYNRELAAQRGAASRLFKKIG